MGLSTSERMGCRRILQQLDISDLESLYKTVCKTKTAFYGKADLIERIIEESKTASELLNRKKVYKDQILQFLNSERIFIPTKLTKEEAIQKSIEHWRKSDISITVKPKAAEKPPSNARQLQNTTSDIDLGQLSFQINSLSIHNNQEDSSKVEKEKSVSDTQGEKSSSNTVFGAPVNADCTHYRHRRLEFTSVKDTVPINLSSAALKTRTEGDKMSGALGSCSEINLLKMNILTRQIEVKQEQEDIGERFCRWFYNDMLPQLEHMIIITDWAATVFYDNVTIHCICTIGECKNIQGEGADMASWMFSDFIRHKRLRFNYNPVGGIMSSLNNHGILTVEVSGTVHKERSFLGLFKHKYKLTKHPDNGKFKITNADLRNSK